MTERVFNLRKFRVQRLLGDELCRLVQFRSCSRLSFLFRVCRKGRDVEDVGREYEQLQAEVVVRLKIVEKRLERVEKMNFGASIEP